MADVRVAACLILSALVLNGCGARASESPQPGITPTPVTRAARTAAAQPSPTPLPHFPTAIVYADPVTRRPVWPTPPPACAVSPATNERPDLGPTIATIGEAPISMASTVLPVIPWRNEFIRSVWVIDRSADGELILSGRRTDGEGIAQFIRQGGQRPTEQVRIPDAARFGPTTTPTGARYADHQIYLVLSSPGCWEFTAKLGDVSRTLTVWVYN